MTPLNVGIPVPLADRVDAAAVRLGVSKAEAVRVALARGLDALDAADGQLPGQTAIGETP